MRLWDLPGDREHQISLEELRQHVCSDAVVASQVEYDGALWESAVVGPYGLVYLLARDRVTRTGYVRRTDFVDPEITGLTLVQQIREPESVAEYTRIACDREAWECKRTWESAIRDLPDAGPIEKSNFSVTYSDAEFLEALREQNGRSGNAIVRHQLCAIRSTEAGHFSVFLRDRYLGEAHLRKARDPFFAIKDLVSRNGGHERGRER